MKDEINLLKDTLEDKQEGIKDLCRQKYDKKNIKKDYQNDVAEFE